MTRGILQHPDSIRNSPQNASPLLRVRKLATALTLVLAICLVAVLVVWYPAESGVIAPLPLHPQPSLIPRTRLYFRGKHLNLEIGRYGNEIEAYKAVSILRNTEVGGKFLVTLGEQGRFIAVRSELPNDLVVAIAEVERLRAAGIVTGADWAVTDPAVVRRWWTENQLFSQMYASLDASRTRVQGPSSTLVADVAATSAFFDLPIRAFLLRGSLSAPRNAFVWQRVPGSRRVALARLGGKYLTASAESVEWQETLAALEQAHRLYESDRRDYTRLPVRLRPSEEFRKELAPGVLLTYASLLLKDLATKSSTTGDSFMDLLTILPDDPNARQEIGVRRASLHARRALAHALEVNREFLLALASSEPRR